VVCRGLVGQAPLGKNRALPLALCRPRMDRARIDLLLRSPRDRVDDPARWRLECLAQKAHLMRPRRLPAKRRPKPYRGAPTENPPKGPWSSDWRRIVMAGGEAKADDAKMAHRPSQSCQRRSKNASACRSKNTSAMPARRPPNWGPFSSNVRRGWDYPSACPGWPGVSGACSD
jgi:hypothetical protein